MHILYNMNVLTLAFLRIDSVLSLSCTELDLLLACNKNSLIYGMTRKFDGKLNFIVQHLLH